LINGVQERQPQNLVRELADAIENRQPVALATVIEVEGASPARPSFKLLVRADGS
jgi:xanthine/CO dehydrogenase XdhC/CoxF family maturation factor